MTCLRLCQRVCGLLLSIQCIALAAPSAEAQASAPAAPADGAKPQVVLAAPAAAGEASCLHKKYLCFTDWKPAPKDSGLVSPKAMVSASTNDPDLASQIPCAALDCEKADDKAFNVVRLDLSGKGNFANAMVLKLLDPKPRSASSTVLISRIPAASAKVVVDGQKLILTVGGRYAMHGMPAQHLLLWPTACLEAKVPLGGKEYPVRILNGDLSLKFDNHPNPSGAYGPGSGSTVCVDTGDGFNKAIPALLGMPALVGGKWYTFRVIQQPQVSRTAGALAHQAIEVTPYTGPTGKLHVTADKWMAILRNKESYLVAYGNGPDLLVPKGTYEMMEYTIPPVFFPAGVPKHAMLLGGSTQGGKELLVIKPGQDAELRIGPPIKAKVDVKQSGRDLKVSLLVTDVGGHTIDYIVNDQGKRPDPPKLVVLDAAGKEVHRVTMEYG